MTTPDHPPDQVDTEGGVSIQTAAAQLGVSVKTIRRRIAAGQLTARKLHTPQGYEWRVDLASAPVRVVDQPRGQVDPGMDIAALLAELQGWRVHADRRVDIDALRAEVAELRALLTPRALPSGPVILPREVIPCAPGRAIGQDDHAVNGVWARVRAWLGGGR